MKRFGGRWATILLALGGWLAAGAVVPVQAGVVAPERTPAKPVTPAAKPARPAARAGTPPAAKSSPASRPAAADTTATGPGALAINELSFLNGQWYGELRSYPMQLDVSIDGQTPRPGQLMSFLVHVKPVPGFNLGIEGDYRATMTWSDRSRSLRSVLTDASGRGVELTGQKTPGASEWLFNSTSEGAPFPFKVRLRPVTKDQIVVEYTSGGRMPLKYEITFNRVTP